jgi:hypothetical protein
MVKLIKIVKSPNVTKKYRAYFDDGTTTDFGAAGMMDYILYNRQNGDKEADLRKNLYINRHKSDLETRDPKRSGYLAMYILWNKRTFDESVADYKNRFNM